MRNIILILAMTFVGEALAVCSSPISRTNFSTLEKLTSNRLNTELNTVYTRANELPGDCITDETVTSAKIDDGTIVNADISATAAIASSKIGAANYAISASDTGVFTTTSQSYVDVTNATVSITTTGKPVEIRLIHGSGESGVHVVAAANATAQGSLKIVRDSTDVGFYGLTINTAGPTAVMTEIPASAIYAFDTPASGTYTYKLQAIAGDANTTIGVTEARIMAREL